MLVLIRTRRLFYNFPHYRLYVWSCGHVVGVWSCGHVSVSVGVSVGGLPQDILPVSPPPPSSCCCILTEYYWHRTWTFSCVYWASITLANWVSMVHSYWVSIRYFHKVYHVINIWCHVSVIDFFEPIIPPAMWDFFAQPRSSDEDQMPGRPSFLNVHFTAFEYISHNMWYIFKCSFKITRAWRLVKSGSLDQQAGEMPDLDSDASREKVRDLELGFEFTGSPVQVCC